MGQWLCCFNNWEFLDHNIHVPIGLWVMPHTKTNYKLKQHLIAEKPEK